MRTPTDLVRKIRYFSRLGYSDSELSEALDVSRSAVYRIRTGRAAYAHIVDDETAPYLFADLPKRPLPTRAKKPSQAPKGDPSDSVAGKLRALLTEHPQSRIASASRDPRPD